MPQPIDEPEVEEAKRRALVVKHKAELIADGCPEKLADEMARDLVNAIAVGEMWRLLFEPSTRRERKR